MLVYEKYLLDYDVFAFQIRHKADSFKENHSNIEINNTQIFQLFSTDLLQITTET